MNMQKTYKCNRTEGPRLIVWGIETMKIFRFLYLNSYAFLLSLLGPALLIIPLYKIAAWILAVQIIGALGIFTVSSRLFSTWPDKKRMMNLLLKKNERAFRPESFALYMQAPCSRLLVKSVLKQLALKNRYRELLVYKEPFFTAIKKNCMPVKTTVYINEKYFVTTQDSCGDSVATTAAQSAE